ncbi:hypothetical protein Mapa_017288 [Marchantia paleacea]|nr:hypothetical protein Mapa_017288 [Marchantia paleacea]
MTGAMSFDGHSATTGVAGGADHDLVSFSSAESIDLPPVAHLNPFGLEILSMPAKCRGVYATRDIPQGSFIEISPFADTEGAVLNRRELERTEELCVHTEAVIETWLWRRDWEAYSSMSTSQCLARVPPDNLTMEYTTTSDIREREELFIYTEREDDDGTLWVSSSSSSSSPSNRRLDVFENSLIVQHQAVIRSLMPLVLHNGSKQKLGENRSYFPRSQAVRSIAVKSRCLDDDIRGDYASFTPRGSTPCSDSLLLSCL